MATLPSFVTFSAGAILTAAQLNNFRDAGNFFLSVPVFEARQTLAQSLTNNIDTPILFDTEDIDNDNGHSTATNTDRYTPQTAGRYQLSGGIGYASNATGFRQAAFWKNGAIINGGAALIQAVTVASTATRMPARTITQFANGSTDYFQLAANQNSGGPLNTVTGIPHDQSTMSVRWVGTT